MRFYNPLRVQTGIQVSNFKFQISNKITPCWQPICQLNLHYNTFQPIATKGKQ